MDDFDGDGGEIVREMGERMDGLIGGNCGGDCGMTSGHAPVVAERWWFSGRTGWVVLGWTGLKSRWFMLARADFGDEMCKSPSTFTDQPFPPSDQSKWVVSILCRAPVYIDRPHIFSFELVHSFEGV